MLGFVIFALVAIGGLIFTLAVMFWPSRSKTANDIGVPGDAASDKKNGNLSDIMEAGSLHQYLQGLHARHGSLAAFYMGEQLLVSAASPQLFKQLSPTFNRPGELFQLFQPLITEHSIQYLNGEEGKERHRYLRAAFQGETLQQFYNLFASVVSEFIGKYSTVPKGQHVNVSRDMFAVAMRAITRSAFGEFFKNESEIEELHKAYTICWEELESRLDGKPVSEERHATYNKNEKKMKDLVRRCISERQSSNTGQDDRMFIDRLLSEGRSDEENLGEAMTFLIGGFHTTGNMLVWALYYLATHKKCQEQLAAEAKNVLGDNDLPTVDTITQLKYTKQVVDETLRCSVLAPWAARYYDEDTQLGEYTIPAKTPIIVALGVVLQDVTIWPSPEVFDPERFTEKAVSKRSARSFDAFGLAGRRCPGFQFANTEAVIVLSMLCRRFKFDLVPGPDVAKVHGLVTHPSRDIELTLVKR